ncbi:MAG: hypothetical protein QNJ09_10790 [Paracoccaceae bacterium]|nr:hypothetical protein [Paracoccaceae bacterium]
MTNFQVVILDQSRKDEETQGDFYVIQHGKGSQRVVAAVDALQGVWPIVVDKLTEIASKTSSLAENSSFQMSSIEFNIGVEAGLSVGLVTKGEASVSVVFERKDDTDQNS